MFYDIDQRMVISVVHGAYSFVGRWRATGHRGGRTASGRCNWAIYRLHQAAFCRHAIAGGILGVAAYWLFLTARPREPVAAIDRRAAPRRSLYVVAAYIVVTGMFWMAYGLGLGTPSR